jgi:arylsulfatase A-like enzyme
MSSNGLGRRELFKAAGVAALGAAVSTASGEEVKPKPPNLLLIHTDQQSCWTLGAYGGALIQTPHIDSLATEGALFKNFFTNSAVCTPSRGCLLTGRYPHAHGAYRNNVELNRDEVTIAHVLREEGYDTGYAGKWHLDGEPKPGWVPRDRAMGFEDSRFMFNRGHWKKITEEPGGPPMVHPYSVIGDRRSYTTDWLTDKTIAFLQQRRTRPFCFMVSFPDPHTPFTVRPPYDTMFDPEAMPVPSTFRQKNKSAWAKRGKGGPRDEQALKRVKAAYCGEVKCIDDNVGRILRCLRETAQLDRTVVVFTTDHGEYMGEHGLMGKNQLYETAYRIPLLIRWPKRISPGTVIDACVSTVDFMPTMLSLIGAPLSGREQGKDAGCLLEGETTGWANEAFLHHSSLERAGIFTPRYEIAYVKGAEPILFDRLHDPEQTQNLFHEPACREVVEELTRRLIAHNSGVQAPAAEWLRELAAPK